MAAVVGSSSSSSSSSSAAATRAPAAGAALAAASSKAATPGTLSLEMPWVEKYRPKELADIVGNEPIVERLKIIGEEGNMNNMILAGPPGTGKTTSVLCLARALLGPAMKDAVLELNASDDRGIDVVRNKIKVFAQKKVTLPPGRHKIIILDEADSMTASAQQALRRTMEVFSSTTRFALACNNSTKIIEPIQSRCAVLRYSRISDFDVVKRLREVCDAESVPSDKDGMAAILFTSEGDMRQALNNLQSTFAGFGSVTAANVMRVCDQPHPMTVRTIVDAAVKGDLDAALASLRSLWTEGYSSQDIVQTVFRVARTLDLDEPLLLDVLKEIGFTQMRVADGLTSILQLQGMCARIHQRAMAHGSKAA